MGRVLGGESITQPQCLGNTHEAFAHPAAGKCHDPVAHKPLFRCKLVQPKRFHQRAQRRRGEEQGREDVAHGDNEQEPGLRRVPAAFDFLADFRSA